MENNGKIVKVDVDGVIRDIFSAMLDVYNRDFNDNKTLADIRFYDVDQSFPRIKEETGVSADKYFFMDNGEHVFYSGAKPCEGAAAALDALHANGFKVVIVTNQLNLANKVNTLKFLEENGIYYDSLCFTKDKHLICGDYLIDDCPDFLMHEDEGATKLCVEYPFNKYVHARVDGTYGSLFEAAMSIVMSEKRSKER